MDSVSFSLSLLSSSFHRSYLISSLPSSSSQRGSLISSLPFHRRCSNCPLDSPRSIVGFRVNWPGHSIFDLVISKPKAKSKGVLIQASCLVPGFSCRIVQAPRGGGRGISTTLILINIMFHFRDFSATYIWVIFPMMISKRVRKVLYWKLRCVCVCVCVWIHLCCIMFNLYILCFMLEYCGLYRCFGKILLTHRCIYEFSLIFTPHWETELLTLFSSFFPGVEF